MRIRLRDFRVSVVPVFLSGFRHYAETVTVIRRNNDFTDFSCKRLTRIRNKFALYFVTSIDDEGKALILGDVYRLDVAAQVIRRAVTVGAAARIVIQRRIRNAVNDKGLIPFVDKAVPCNESCLGFRRPSLVDFFDIPVARLIPPAIS